MKPPRPTPSPATERERPLVKDEVWEIGGLLKIGAEVPVSIHWPMVSGLNGWGHLTQWQPLRPRSGLLPARFLLFSLGIDEALRRGVDGLDRLSSSRTNSVASGG